MHAEPTVSIHRDALPDAAGEASPDLREDAAPGTAEHDLEATQLSAAAVPAARSAAEPADARRRRTSRRRRPTARRGRGPTRSLRSRRRGGARTAAAVRGPAGAARCSPRPSVASRSPRGRPWRRSPGRITPRPAPTPRPGAPWAPTPPRAGASTPPRAGPATPVPAFWPFTDEDEAKNDVHTGKEGRGWLRTAIVVALLLVLVVAMAIAFYRGREDGEHPDGSSENPSQSADATGTPVEIAGVQRLRPRRRPARGEPRDRQERHRRQPRHVVDDDDLPRRPRPGRPQARRRPDARPRQGPEGLLGDGAVQGRAHLLRGVRRLRRRDRGPRTPWTSSTRSAAKNAASEQAVVELDPAPSTRYLLVWLTKLPPADGGFRGEITEITVRS